MKLNLSKMLTLLALTLSLIAVPVWAISKDEAKAKGLIGEQSNGYLGIVTASPNADLKTLVNTINNKRKAAYVKSASKAGVERNVFEARMGQRLQDKTPAGQYIKLPNGKWKKK
ncbi:MAG: YdbL family protein [Neptuniibacter sp.]